MATKIARLKALRILFVRQSEDSGVLGEGTRSGPPAAPDQRGYGSSDRYFVEDNAAELGDFLTNIVNQHGEQAEHNKVANFAMVQSKWNTIYKEVFCHLKAQTALTSRYKPKVPAG
jgi:hypothetical protein